MLDSVSHAYSTLTVCHLRTGSHPGSSPRRACEHARRRELQVARREFRGTACEAVSAEGADLRADARYLLYLLLEQMVALPVLQAAPESAEELSERLVADVRLILQRARAARSSGGLVSGHAVIDGVLRAWDELHLAGPRVWGSGLSARYAAVYERLTERYVEYGPSVGGYLVTSKERGEARKLRGACFESVLTAERSTGVALRADARHLSVTALDQLVLTPVYLSGRRALAKRLRSGLVPDLCTVLRHAPAQEPLSSHALLMAVSATWSEVGYARVGIWGSV